MHTAWFEIADGLYLAAHGAGELPQAASRSVSDRPGPGPAPGSPPAAAAGSADRDPAEPPDAEPLAAAPPPDEEAGAEAEPAAQEQTLPPAPGERSAGAAARAAGRLLPADSARLPPLRALGGEQALSRALRPLRGHRASLTAVELDEDATADAAAYTGRWLPVTRPVPERWLEAVLVVDSSTSMGLWQRSAAELASLLRRTGAFRDVRVHRIDGDRPVDGHRHPDVPGLGGARPGPHARRHVVMVLTDGVGDAWHDGSAGAALLRWGGRASVVVVQVLAQSAWHRTGLPVRLADIRVPAPAAPNASWHVGRAAGMAVPVIELNARWMGRWARMASRPEAVARSVWVTLPQEGRTQPPPAGDVPSPMQRVVDFRAHATPAAWELAARLAAVPLNLRTMELVLRVGSRPAGPAELAEVLLGGLLRTVGANSHDPTDIGYEFHSGVRELLLSAGRRDETRYLLMAALDRLSEGREPLAGLRALIADPCRGGDPVHITSALVPYAEIQIKVMKAISGPYLGPLRLLTAGVRNAVGSHRDTPDTTVPQSSAAAISRQGSIPTEVDDMSDPNPSTREPAPFEQGSALRMPDPGQKAKGTSVPPSPVRPGPVAEKRRETDQPRVWEVPTRNPSFTGRTQELEDLHERLSVSGAAAVLPEALHGLGGVGKSQIAVEYLYRHAADFDAVWWIPAERRELILQSLTRLGGQLGVESSNDGRATVAGVLEALRIGRPYSNWMLVFDNAEDPDTVRQFFPAGNAGRILVTSRNALWARVARTVDVDVFSVEESVELLRRRGPELVPEQAARVATALGNLPLAIEQAAAWLSETGMPVDEYLLVFEDERSDLSQRRSELLASGVPVDYPEPVAAAWNMSLRRLADRNPGALQLLQICSFFAPEPIPRRFFTGVRGVELPRELSEVLQDPIKLGHAIRAINRYALIRLNYRDNTILMHRLVQAVLVGQMSPAERADLQHAAHVLLANSDPNDPAQENGPQYAQLLVHARFAKARTCDDRWVRQTLKNLINFLFRIGDYVTCRDYGLEVLEEWNERFGESDLLTLSTSRTVGHALRALGEIEKVTEIDERCLVLLREHYGDSHPETLMTASAVAQDARLHGDFQRALDLEHERWQHVKREFDDESEEALASSNDYALALRRDGRFAQALEIDRAARDTAARSLGLFSPLALLIASNMSIDVMEMGDYAQARDLQEQTVERVNRAFANPAAPVRMLAARTLATARRRAGDHQGALDLIRTTLDLYQRRYSERDLNRVSSLLNLSMVLRQTADLVQAKEAGERACVLFGELLGTDHPYWTLASLDLAVTLRLLGETEQARQMNERSHRVLEEKLGADHPATITALINLASDHYALADYAEAEQLDRRAREMSEAKLGQEHPTTLACMMNLSLDLRAVGNAQEGAELHTRTVDALRRTLGPDHPSTVGALRGLRADCDVEVL